MELLITKNSGKPHIIKYRRYNHSETWMPADDYFVRHDLSHFAIETMLGYKDAFMGMLNNGMDIKDFEDREKRKKIAMTQAACYAESTANLFLMETTDGKLAAFNEVATTAFKTAFPQWSPPTLSNQQVEAIRIYLKQLLAQWQELPLGATLVLTIDL